jgi:hypothetical protein
VALRRPDGGWAVGRQAGQARAGSDSRDTGGGGTRRFRRLSRERGAGAAGRHGHLCAFGLATLYTRRSGWRRRWIRRRRFRGVARGQFELGLKLLNADTEFVHHLDERQEDGAHIRRCERPIGSTDQRWNIVLLVHMPSMSELSLSVKRHTLNGYAPENAPTTRMQPNAATLRQDRADFEMWIWLNVYIGLSWRRG